ncbi:hypothetical protein ACFE04_009011 [Oxalis oulophora]
MASDDYVHLLLIDDPDHRQTLLSFKAHLEMYNQVNTGEYTNWDKLSENPCEWYGISCFLGKVNGIILANMKISGEMFGNFSALTELTHLDLSSNTIRGSIPDDIMFCRKLSYFNVSHNILMGEIKLTELNNLEIVDLSMNRMNGGVQLRFLPHSCESLRILNLSDNNFTGRIDNNMFSKCLKLEYLDLSSNNFSGDLSDGFARLKEFSVSENNLTGEILSTMFPVFCNLQILDLSRNYFYGEFPAQVSNCRRLVNLDLGGNNFSGKIPQEIGSILTLESLYLGSNKFSREIPDSLLKLTNLAILDMSKNNFGGDIQEIFGKFTQVKFLALYGNSYTGGIHSLGILMLLNVARLDLSYNNFSGPLPLEVSQMSSLKFLILACNQFSGNIPPEYGHMSELQALDLSFNELNGSIPASIGNLRSLLWLTLANNALSGKIPPQIGNCSSLLWLNLANNQLSGEIPPDLINIGRNATAIFETNRKVSQTAAGFGECLVMKRWIPAHYPPFSFVYDILTRKSCRSMWDRLLKGYAIFPTCVWGSTVQTLQITGYLQLSLNLFSGEIPYNIGKMLNFSMLHLGGSVPSTGQLATFEEDSYLGDPNLILPAFIKNDTKHEEKGNVKAGKKKSKSQGYLAILIPVLALLISGAISFTSYIFYKRQKNSSVFLLDGRKDRHDSLASSSSSQISETECISMDKTMLKKSDILIATRNFSKDRIVGSGGYGTVYRGTLPDGRKVAVKKLHREGIEGEKEFWSEIEILTRNSFGWPHPNIVQLYGFCIVRSKKLLVYEYVDGGSLEDFITGKIKLPPKRLVGGPGEEFLVDWARRVVGQPLGSDGLAEEMRELLKIGVKCTAESPQARPNMMEVLAMVSNISLAAE